MPTQSFQCTNCRAALEIESESLLDQVICPQCRQLTATTVAVPPPPLAPRSAAAALVTPPPPLPDQAHRSVLEPPRPIEQPSQLGWRSPTETELETMDDGLPPAAVDLGAFSLPPSPLNSPVPAERGPAGVITDKTPSQAQLVARRRRTRNWMLWIAGLLILIAAMLLLMD